MFRPNSKNRPFSSQEYHYGAGGERSYGREQFQNTLDQGRGRGRGRARGRGRGRGGEGGYRGAQSLGSLNLSKGGRPNSRSQEEPTSEGHGQSPGPDNRGHRKYPIGFKELDRLTTQQADVIILELLNERSGFRILLEQDRIPEGKFELVVKVLAGATLSQSNKESLNELLNTNFHQKFIDNLLNYSLKLKRQNPQKCQEFFSDVLKFLEAFVYGMPTSASDRLPNFVECSVSTLITLQSSGHAEENLLRKYECLQNTLTEAAERWRQEKKSGIKSKKKWEPEMDHMEPPDDFRELSVLPTPMDIAVVQPPFLRRNVLHGQYNDGQHYLDVQFRLLREDFVRPLRTGINKFRNDTRARVTDVRIYRNVAYIGPTVERRKIFHEVQLEVSKRMKFENSKRLLFGNLLCFSKDNFQNIILGSVAERDPEKLKNGVIGVEFQSDLDQYDMTGKFVMVESRAYFMAYKHVLQALKDMPEDIPLERYVLHVDPNMNPPQYMTLGQTYDLRVIKNMNIMKATEAFNRLYRRRLNMNLEEPEEYDQNHLQRVSVSRDLTLWPSEHDLGLDQSQRRALRSALTRELAIIQGPPGTGKTFIGLKIVQILLHNSDIWKMGNDPTPILVVCFTNHALDQFLEGMTQFTSNIVRIGSRTQSENIARFQINRLVRTVVDGRNMPKFIHDRKKQVNFDLQSMETVIRRLKQVERECLARAGILSLEMFESQRVIPNNLLKQISKIESKEKITTWLTVNYQPHHSPKQSHSSGAAAGTQQNTVQRGVKKENGEDELDDEELVLKDAEDLLGLEERDRIIEEIDYEDFPVPSDLCQQYELTKDSLMAEITELRNILQEKEDNKLYLTYIIRSRLLEAIEYGLNLPENDEEMTALEQHDGLNIWNLDFQRRWQMYKHWLKGLYIKVKGQLIAIGSDFRKRTKAMQEVKNQEYLHAMRQASIVGMTTTGAAQLSTTLQDLAPAIVVIEEAAEILESHVITSLSSKCQHLIMIGDHQQLRPSATVYELATKYGLETSLFERMIKNGIAYETLEYQHRMRPSISSLLVPSIYATLKDHPSVQEYPSITGVTKDLFFISHEIHELEESDDNNSHENQHEAELLIGLCRHLMLQGYSPEDVTILTPYSGQFFLLRKLQRQHSACSGVRICVVDNFQGEENKIILLSLVRSNVEGKVGFLRTENRVCVALSRAKHSLYVTGNIDLLSETSELWKKIRTDLENMGSIGRHLTLRCENHPDQLTKVSSGHDFITKSPEGGCLQVCGKSLPRCRHSCQKFCHMDDLQHEQYKCQVNCPKTLCALDHKCPRKCWEACEPCMVMMKKVLPCGHVHNIQCHINPQKYNCPTKVEKEIPHCQHKAIMDCCVDPCQFICPEDCDTRVDCGHKCRKKCHRTRDPDHLEYSCMEKCTKINAGCTKSHPCLKRCYEECGECTVKVDKILLCGHEAKDVECSQPLEQIQCKKKCKKTLPCGHACKLMCYRPCGACLVMVKKTVPSCNHTITIACSRAATTDMCDGRCPKKLPCGHPCVAACRDPCTQQCTELVTTVNRCPKGHAIRLPCHLSSTVRGEAAWAYCEEPCGQQLECEHMCVGSCGRCLLGRLHVSCNRPCDKPLVCGHVCKSPCSAACPPCQEACEWKCSHSRCRKKCGQPCEPCKEICNWACEHQKCRKLCGDKCTRKPCDQPCKKKLKCGHPCTGFCGDPCPPLCRKCDREQLTEFILLGNEEDDDARFVLLEDCQHCIEVKGLEGWLGQEDGEISMKTCPKCRKSIYNNRRYQNIVLKSYEAVRAVKKKFFASKEVVKRKDIELVLQDPKVVATFQSHVVNLLKKLGIGPRRQNRQDYLSDGELKLYHFQAQVLKKASSILHQEQDLDNTGVLYGTASPSLLPGHKARLRSKVEEIVSRVMEKLAIVAPQMEHEVSCELQRLAILPAYWAFQEKFMHNSREELKRITTQLEILLDPTVVFDNVLDQKVRDLLKKSEKYVGSLGISESEKVQILQAMGLRQGHWYKCPNGHIYCITECGGAMVESECPDCKCRIGGGNHALRADNAVATEMDGAQHAAWSEHNNMANFDLGNI